MRFLGAALQRTPILLHLAVALLREVRVAHMPRMRTREGLLTGRAEGGAAAAAARVPKGLEGGAAAGAAAAAAATTPSRTSTRPRWPTTTVRTARYGRPAARWAREGYPAAFLSSPLLLRNT